MKIVNCFRKKKYRYRYKPNPISELHQVQFRVFRFHQANQYQTPAWIENIPGIAFFGQIFLGNSTKPWLQWSKVIYRVEHLGSICTDRTQTANDSYCG